MASLKVGKFFNLIKLNQIANITRVTPSACLTYRKFTVLSAVCTKITTVQSSHSEFKRLYSDKDTFREQEEQKEREYNESLQQQTMIKANEVKNSEEQAKFQDMRDQILKASLEHVPIYGWSRQSITKGAESLGYPGVVHGMFSKGPIELVQYFYYDSNRKLVDIMKSKTETKDDVGADGQSKPVIVSKKQIVPVEFVKEAIKCRLMMLEPYIKSWPQAIALMSLPQNASNSLANLLTLVDDICYYSGDRSVDFGWYIRRVGLATIYKVTELYMIQDTSPNYAKTWEFLERRIEDGVYIHNFIEPSDETAKNVHQMLGTAFETARSMLGMNFNRR